MTMIHPLAKHPAIHTISKNNIKIKRSLTKKNINGQFWNIQMVDISQTPLKNFSTVPCLPDADFSIHMRTKRMENGLLFSTHLSSGLGRFQILPQLFFQLCDILSFFGLAFLIQVDRKEGMKPHNRRET